MLALIGSFEKQMQRITGHIDRALEQCGSGLIGDLLILSIFGFSQPCVGTVWTVMPAEPFPA